MKIISSPPLLRLCVVALLLVPVALALQILLWQGPAQLETFGWRMVLSAWVSSELMIWILAYGILRAKKWAAVALEIMILVWGVFIVLWSKWGILSIAILLALWGVHQLILREYRRSYLNSGKSIWAGAPTPIPSLLVMMEGKAQPLKVARIDQEGFFAFEELAITQKQQDFGLAKVSLQLKDREVPARAHWICFDEKMGGVGLKFAKHSPDESKDIADFIESLRGKGYVS